MKLLYPALFLAFTSFAHAQSESCLQGRDASRLTCDQLQRLVNARSVLRIEGEFGCERVVLDQNSCGAHEYLSAFWVATSDNDDCFPGYVCRPNPRR